MKTITLKVSNDRLADALGEWIAKGSAIMMLQEDELYYEKMGITSLPLNGPDCTLIRRNDSGFEIMID